jgi:ligand-binding sensor domain-containing protein
MGPIQSVLVDYEETIWIGTNTGIYRKPVQRVEFEQASTIQNAVCLYEQRPGEIWAGTFDRGLWLLHTPSGASRQVVGNGLTQEAGILSISGNDSTLWVASIEGVYELDISDQASTQASSSLPRRKDNLPSFLYKITEDSEGRLWLASDGDGVYCVDTNKTILRYATSDDGTKLGAVYAVVEDNRGVIWISTAQRGIFYFSGEGFTSVQLTRENRSKAYTTMVSLSPILSFFV